MSYILKMFGSVLMLGLELELDYSKFELKADISIFNWPGLSYYSFMWIISCAFISFEGLNAGPGPDTQSRIR